MKRYAQFYILQNNKKEELIGTNGILPIDGRWSINTCIKFVAHHSHVKYLKNKKKIVSFKIKHTTTGKFSDAKDLTNYIKI